MRDRAGSRETGAPASATPWQGRTLEGRAHEVLQRGQLHWLPFRALADGKEGPMGRARLVVAGCSARESKQRWGFESTKEDVGAVIAAIRTGVGGTVGMARFIIISCCTRTRGRARASYVVSSATAPLASFFWSRPAHARNCFPALNAGEHSGEEGTHVLCEHKLLAASPPICMYVSATALIYDPIQCSASPRYALSTPDGGPSEFSPRN